MLESAVHPPPIPSQQREEELVTSDFMMELRCGMDTCVKAFKARQKCVQQLLVHWEKGRLNDGLRYIGELPRGKREAVVVDVLRITDLQSLGVDLEACVLLLPLIVDVLESKFELCVYQRHTVLLAAADLRFLKLIVICVLSVAQLFMNRYLSVGIDSGHKLFNAFSPVVKDTRDARQYRSRAINLAGEERYGFIPKDDIAALHLDFA